MLLMSKYNHWDNYNPGLLEQIPVNNPGISSTITDPKHIDGTGSNTTIALVGASRSAVKPPLFPNVNLDRWRGDTYEPGVLRGEKANPMFENLVQKLGTCRRQPNGKARGSTNQPEVDDDPSDDIRQDQQALADIERQEQAEDRAEEAGQLVAGDIPSK